MRNLLIVLITFFLLNGCEKNEGIYEIQDVIYLENKELFNSITCFSVSNINLSEGFVIADNKEYQELTDSMRINPINPNVNCDTASLVYINFSEYSLIGIMTTYGTCDTIKRKVLFDDSNNYIYNVDIKEYTGSCNLMLVMNLNLALIPKIPDNHIVEFEINKHN